MKKKEFENIKEKIELIIEDLTKNHIIGTYRNYKDFEFIHLGKEEFNLLRYEMLNHKWNRTKTLFECYGRPSTAKISIYEDYKKKFDLAFADFDYNDILIAYGINSYNCNIITLKFAYIKNNKYIVNIIITPMHDYITIYECMEV